MQTGYSWFYGTLHFTRPLQHPELQTLTRIIDADTFHQTQTELAAQGLVLPNGRPPGHIDLRINHENSGLEYRKTHRSYRMVEAVNFIIANAQRQIPDFGLTGALFAETQYRPHYWQLRINPHGWAEQIPCPRHHLMRHDPRLYAHRVWQDAASKVSTVLRTLQH